MWIKNLSKLVLPASFLISSLSKADQFHYHNVLIGDRAVGLGGAYAGVSDDASGVYYNPAGLAFALSSDISGSANAFYSKKYTYKKTIGNANYVENSSGSLPTFFGGIQKLEKTVPGLVAGFGLYSTDSELRDQNDVFDNLPYGDTTIRRLHRAQNMRASTFNYSAAAALRVSGTFAVGMALSYFTVDELFQDYQDISSYETGTNLLADNSQNVRQHLKANGFEPTIGMQVSLTSKLSLGFVLKKGFYISQNYENNIESSFIAYGVPRDEVVAAPGEVQQGSATRRTISSYKDDEPLGSMPLNARLGLALFASTRLLWTFDVTYFEGVDFAANKILKQYQKEPVMNLATGAEYYLTPSIPLRLGLFTNNDARPDVDSNKVNQADHIDFIGGTVFLAWTQPNSQIALGVIQQNGEGKAQKVGGVVAVQDVEATSTTIAFSATHSF